MTAKKPLPWPPTPEEIGKAVALAGYPLELRIHEVLRSTGFDPTMPFRTPVGGDTGTAEIDLLGGVTHFSTTKDGEVNRLARLSIKIFIQAKRLHEGTFVGLIGPEVSDYERKVNRATVAGLPSWNVLHKYDHLANDLVIGTDRGLAMAFDELIKAPQCLHWTVVKISEKGKKQHYRASHDDHIQDDFETLIRGIAWQKKN